MSSNSRVKITAYIVSGAWSVVLFLAGIPVPHTWVKVLSALPLLIVAGFAAFDNWVWQLGPIRRLVGRPLLSGTWSGTLTSLRDGETGRELEHEPIPVVIVIHQSSLTLSVLLMSAESKSRSISAIIETSSPNTFVVHYHYDNLPGLLVRAASPLHAGSARFEVSGLSPTALEGEYWTDRRSRGTFTAERVSGKQFGTFADAVKELGIGRDT